MFVRPVGRLAAAVATVALLTTGLPTLQAQAATETYRTKATHAARWQSGQLTHGSIYNSTFGFTDWGLTIDTGFAMAADGTTPVRLGRLRTALANHVRDYTTFGGDTFAGPTAKLLLATKVLRAAPRNFGGVNVRAQLLRLMAPASAGFEHGRFRDTGSQDFSNVIGQSYAVIGLARTGGVPVPAVSYLIKQRCSAGYFALAPTVGKTCNQAGGTPDVDATAIALQAMIAARAQGVQFPDWLIGRTGTWLASAQKRNGSFGGGTGTAAPNSNSTGLAAQALFAVGRNQARLRAASFVAKLQITAARAAAGPARSDIGAIAYNRAAFNAAISGGITDTTRDQWRRSTPQAFFALHPVPLTRLLAPRVG
jgi:hypothetical protein